MQYKRKLSAPCAVLSDMLTPAAVSLIVAVPWFTQVANPVLSRVGFVDIKDANIPDPELDAVICVVPSGNLMPPDFDSIIPFTVSGDPGVVVPMPTLPAAVMYKRPPPHGE